MNRLDMKSKNNVDFNVSRIADLFPNVIKENGNEKLIDFDALKQELSECIIDDKKEKFELTWPGKKEAILNANRPSKNILRPLKDKSKNFDVTKNIYIEGDNLDVLKILQESYLGKIKCIYIDPPYNTGNDFIYNDYFDKNAENELFDSGQIDELGNRLITNTQSNGRFHSDWLNMMYPRLKLSRNLLTRDGLIFISINDIEQSNLKKMCDEIFGERNFVAQLVWTNKEGGGGSDTKLIKVKHEYILCYSKDVNNATINGVKVSDEDRYTCEDKWVETRGKYQLVKLDSASLGYVASLDYPITAPDGTDIYPNKNGEKVSRWRWGKDKLQWGRDNDYLEFKKDKEGNWNVYSKQYINADTEGNIVERTNRPFALIDKYSSTQASKQLQKLLGGKYFDYSKPKDLIKFLIDISTKDDDIVLDYFSGSATTAHAVLELNKENNTQRKFIMVQAPEKIAEKMESYKKGYRFITDIGEDRIIKAQEELNLLNENFAGFRVFKIDSSNMKDDFYKTPGELEQSQLKLFETNIKEDRSSDDLLAGVVLDLGLTLDYKVEEKSIKENKVYFINGNELVVCFDETVNIDIIDEVSKIEPLMAVFRDDSFKTDSDKINLEERFKKLSPNTKISIL